MHPPKYVSPHEHGWRQLCISQHLLNEQTEHSVAVIKLLLLLLLMTMMMMMMMIIIGLIIDSIVRLLNLYCVFE